MTINDLQQIKQEKQKLVIAMKGHPGTGKSTVAHALATTLHIPLLDKDDIRDSTLQLQQHSPHLSPLLNDLSSSALCHLASTQLRVGLNVIIDSPLSRRSHLNSLLHVASSHDARLVVVECTASDEEEWRRRVENRGSDANASWHKPGTWQDMETLLVGYGGCTLYDFGDVPRILVDTTDPKVCCGGVEGIVNMVLEFIESHVG